MNRVLKLAPILAIIALIALAATLMAPAAFAAPASDDRALAALVDKYFAWRGGAAFERMSSVHERGEADAAGLHGAYESWAERAGRARVRLELGAFTSDEAVTPDGSWDLTQSGQVEQAAQATVDNDRRQAAIDFGDAFRGRDGATVTLARSEVRDGKTWSVVRLTFGDADVYEAYIDPDTGALLGFHIVQDKTKAFVAYRDWRMIDGVRMAFDRVGKSELPGGDTRTVLSSIEINRPIEPAVYERPAAVRTAQFAPGVHTTGWIDFEFFGGERIFVPAKVNGKAVQVLLDSGAQTTVFDRSFAEAAGVKTQGAITAVGAGGAGTAELANGVDIQIGDLSLRHLTVAVIDLSGINRRLGHPLPVILGNEVFRELVIDIDFAHHRIAFTEPSAFTPPAGAVEVPVPLVDNLRAVPVSVEGRPPVLFDFDLGNGGALDLFAAYWQPAKLLDGRRTSTVLVGGTGGVKVTPIAAVRDVAFAGQHFADVPTDFNQAGSGALDSTKTLGNIGLQILNRFRLSIDYDHDRLWALADPERTATPFKKDRLGLHLTKTDKGFVSELVSPGSPAAAAGFKTGQVFALVDGKPREGWPGRSLDDLSDGQAGAVVVLTLPDGTTKRLTLADYY